MRIVEEFYSIQGESTFMGCTCYFVRLHGCNLDCRGCDTKYASDAGNYYESSVTEVLDRCLKSPARIIEITGGEPLLQFEQVHELCVELVKQGRRVLIETNGSICVGPFRKAPPSLLSLIIDVKGPGTGMSDHICWANLSELVKGGQYKFVIGSRDDFEFAKEVIMKYGLHESRELCEVLISPLYGEMPFCELARWVLDELPFARLQVQLHKLIWPNVDRGV